MMVIAYRHSIVFVSEVLLLALDFTNWVEKATEIPIVAVHRSDLHLATGVNRVFFVVTEENLRTSLD